MTLETVQLLMEAVTAHSMAADEDAKWSVTFSWEGRMWTLAHFFPDLINKLITILKIIFKMVFNCFIERFQLEVVDEFVYFIIIIIF